MGVAKISETRFTNSCFEKPSLIWKFILCLTFVNGFEIELSSFSSFLGLQSYFAILVSKPHIRIQKVIDQYSFLEASCKVISKVDQLLIGLPQRPICNYAACFKLACLRTRRLIYKCAPQ